MVTKISCACAELETRHYADIFLFCQNFNNFWQPHIPPADANTARVRQTRSIWSLLHAPIVRHIREQPAIPSASKPASLPTTMPKNGLTPASWLLTPINTTLSTFLPRSTLKSVLSPSRERIFNGLIFVRWALRMRSSTIFSRTKRSFSLLTACFLARRPMVLRDGTWRLRVWRLTRRLSVLTKRCWSSWEKKVSEIVSAIQ